MGMMSEFKEFAMKGNVMDLAVGVIIGAAFGKIVDSAVNDLIMPVIGRIVGKVDFKDLFIALSDIPAGVPATLDAVKKAGVPVLAWGNFLTIALNFIILAFIIFLMVKAVNNLRRRLEAEKPAPPAAPPPADVALLTEIRDLLARK